MASSKRSCPFPPSGRSVQPPPPKYGGRRPSQAQASQPPTAARRAFDNVAIPEQQQQEPPYTEEEMALQGLTGLREQAEHLSAQRQVGAYIVFV